MNKVFWCRVCVTPTTRPRTVFKGGICNACLWHEQKKKIDWNRQWDKLEKICDKFRSNNNNHDCIVPVSGGKDSSTIAYQFKHKLGMNPLTVTFSHPIWTQMGWRNWNNFVSTGFDNILISPDQEKYRQFNKDFFISHGMPKQAFVVGISSAIIKLAKKFNIKLICFAELGELEYGGKVEYLKKFNRKFLTDIYYEGQEDSGKYGTWWEVPSDKDLEDIYVTWYSLFKNWDPQDNALFAKKYTGMEMMVGGNIGTFTNFSQNECKIQDLHCFLQYCKLSMGRAVSDASIEIRHNRLSRSEGVKIVNEIDGQFPVEHLETYLDYFEMSKKQFFETIKKHVNFDLLKENDKIERPYVLKKEVI